MTTGESETITTKKSETKNVDVEEEEGSDERIQSGSPNPLISLPNWETPCSSFFQQKGAIDFQSYLTLKKEEKYAIEHYAAATKIQAVWRGFLTRCNLEILNASATHIQALIRGVLARKKYAAMFQEKAANEQLKVENEAATKIQAAWRGYYSRKTKLNFKEYKKIQEKNAALKKSIDQINNLETALLSKSGINISSNGSQSSDSARSSGSLKSAAGGESVENLIKDDREFLDLCNSMSTNRVAELYNYATTETSKGQKKQASTHDRFRTEFVGDLFPVFPNIEGLIKPDAKKVGALKESIRLLHQQMKSRESENMLKMHFLLRTVVLPGVYSDIYTNELTEIEQQLKAMKFWTPPPDPRKLKGIKKRVVPEKVSKNKKSAVPPSSVTVGDDNGAFGQEDDSEEEAEFIYHPPFPMVNKNRKFPSTSDE